MANSGFEHLSHDCDALFVRNFAEYDYVVGPPGVVSCTSRNHLHDEKQPEKPQHYEARCLNSVSFWSMYCKVENLDASFPHRVGFHQSCHGQRGLGLSQMSELMAEPFSKPAQLLKLVKGLELIPLTRTDECCGFGGTFSVMEEAVSVKMGKDRVADHVQHGAEYIAGADVSCLMHLEGILRRNWE